MITASERTRSETSSFQTSVFLNSPDRSRSPSSAAAIPLRIETNSKIEHFSQLRILIQQSLELQRIDIDEHVKALHLALESKLVDHFAKASSVDRIDANFGCEFPQRLGSKTSQKPSVTSDKIARSLTSPKFSGKASTATEKQERKTKRYQFQRAYSRMKRESVHNSVSRNLQEVMDKQLGRTKLGGTFQTCSHAHCLPEFIYLIASQIVTNSYFSLGVTFLILTNAIFMAIETDNTVHRSYDRWQLQQNEASMKVLLEPMPTYLQCIDLIFAVLFGIEILLRMAADGVAFVMGDQKIWNMLDLLVVVTSWLEVIATLTTEDTGSSMTPPLRLLRLLRMLRSLRVVRGLRFSAQLRLVLLTVLHSLTPLCGCFAIFTMIMFIFAIFFMQFISATLDDSIIDAESIAWGEALMPSFGSFWESLLCLLQVITGGEDWANVYGVLKLANPVIGWVFVVYIVLMVLGVLNVISAVFVEGALSKAKGDRQLALAQEQEQKEELMFELVREFRKIDTDENDVITRDEWEEFCSDKKGQDFLRLCDFGLIVYAEDLFQMLDIEDSGQIEIDEFVTGLMQIHGAVHKFDVQAIIQSNKTLLRKLAHSTKSVMESVRSLEVFCYRHFDAMATSKASSKDDDMMSI